MQHKKITLLDLGGVVFQSTGISNEKIHWETISRLNHKYGYELNVGEDKYPAFLNENEKWSINQIYSYDYKMVKSNPEFFKTLLNELPQYRSNEMLFIDDSIEKIESAKKSGIEGLLYLNNAQIINELKKQNRLTA